MRHPLPVARIAADFADDRGLSDAERAARLGRYGPNAILERPVRAWLAIAADTARDPMIWFLVACAGLYLALGSYQEGITLLVAIAPLIGMDVFLHRRTQASTEGLGQQLAHEATVIRGGAAAVIPALDLVPGDLVEVASGEAFPADGVVVAGERLQVDEASLTGESHPVAKRPLAALPAGGPEVALDGDRWGFAGTRLLTGRARLRVVYTGAETLYGAIVQGAIRPDSQRTPLQVAIGSLVRGLLVGAALLCATLAFVRLRQGAGWVDALISAATLAVAALPEEFPVVLTVFLGVGVYRLARRRALVRRAVCVENIGRVSCVCADKTGTITLGRLAVDEVVPADGVTADALAHLAALASRADSGDPLDAAVCAHAATRAGAGAEVTRVAEFPFTEDRRRETAIVRVDGRLRAIVKGSPEVVLAACALDAATRDRWQARVDALGRRGRKVIGCAHLDLDAHVAGVEPDGLTFAGLVAFADPVRDGVADAVAQCRAAGIHVLMLTGDHPATAEAIGAAIGLGGGTPRCATGDAVLARLEARDRGFLRDLDVVARALPAHKLAIVRALQAEGEIVAVTGDGVNDVPALLAADVGIAMGERGTRSARDVAAMVLLDDDFHTITRAIAEGRQLFANLQRGFQYLLMIHLPLVITATLVPLAGYPILYLPVHIVWLEAIIHPSAMLAFQAASTARIGDAAPRRSAQLFTRGEWAQVLAVGLLAAVLMIATYDRSLGAELAVPHARAMCMVVMTLVSAAITGALSRLRTAGARWMIGLTLTSTVVMVQVPALSRLLRLRPLHADDWAIAVAAAALAVGLPLAIGAGIGRLRGGRGTGAGTGAGAAVAPGAGAALVTDLPTL